MDQQQFLTTAPVDWLVLVELLVVCVVIISLHQWHRARRHDSDAIVLATACLAGVIIFGCGFLIQPAIEEFFSGRPDTVGTLYYIEFGGWSALKAALLDGPGSALIPGAFIGYLFFRFRHWHIGTAAVAGALVLAAYDILNVGAVGVVTGTTTIKQLPSLLGASLICDMIGGPIGGILVWGLTRSIYRVSGHSRTEVRVYLIGLATTALIIPASLVGIYFLFLHPLPTHVNLSLEKYRETVVRFSESAAHKKIQFQKGSFMERYSDSQLWSAANVNNISLLGWSYVRPLILTAVKSRVHIGSVEISAAHAVPARVLSAVGCKTAADAAKAAITSTQLGLPVDLSNTAIRLHGYWEKLAILSNDKVGGLIAARYGTPVQLGWGPDGKENLLFLGKSNFDFPALPGLLVVFKGVPNFFRLMGAGISAHPYPGRDYVSLEIGNNGGSKTYEAAPGKGEGCQVSALIETEQPKGLAGEYAEQFFVLQILPAKVYPFLTVDLAGVQVDSSQNDLPLENGENIADYLSSDANKGKLLVGTKKLQLSAGDTVLLAGGEYSLTGGLSGLSADGTGSYVLLNGRLVTESVWSGMAVEIRAGIISVIVAASLAAIGYLGKRCGLW